MKCAEVIEDNAGILHFFFFCDDKCVYYFADGKASVVRSAWDDILAGEDPIDCGWEDDDAEKLELDRDEAYKMVSGWDDSDLIAEWDEANGERTNTNISGFSGREFLGLPEY